MTRKFLFLGLLLMVGVGSTMAQSNDRLDELLGQASARLDTSAYLILSSVKLVAETADPGTAFQAAVTAGWLTPDRHPSDALSVQDLSFLLMKTQKLPGGLEWMLLPSPRAAYRELVYRNVVNSSGGPDRVVAGDEVIRTFNAVRALVGGKL